MFRLVAIVKKASYSAQENTSSACRFVLMSVFVSHFSVRGQRKLRSLPAGSKSNIKTQNVNFLLKYTHHKQILWTISGGELEGRAVNNILIKFKLPPFSAKLTPCYPTHATVLEACHNDPTLLNTRM